MNSDLSPSYILPDWPAPTPVRAVSTTRIGGSSLPPFASLNLGDHVGDDPAAVAANRQRLARDLELPSEPVWLNQVHGNKVVEAGYCCDTVAADASFAREAGRVCVVMTADCLPVLLCNQEGTRVGIAHGGWRGLSRGVIAAVVARMDCDPDTLLAWLGPAIGRDVFEVGEEVRAAFMTLDLVNVSCFRPSPTGRWLADLYGLAHRQLQALGISAVYGGHWCTSTERERFFSYRRDGRTGRMASLIWLAE